MKGSYRETVFYVIAGVVLAWVLNQGLAYALSTDMPVVAVESNSMIPVFYKGDILVLNGADPSQLKIGDVIVFSVPGRDVPVVHRIVKINTDGSFQTKGDNNPGQLSFEQYVSRSNVHGKVFLIIPYLGWVKIGVLEFVVPNLIWVIALFILVVLIYQCRRLV